jgi:hypothetical protein
MTIPHEQSSSPTDPNRGINVKVFLISVLIAAALVAVMLLIVVDRKGTKVVATPTQTTGPTSQLSLPAIHQPKPSPLHPMVLRVATRSSSAH